MAKSSTTFKKGQDKKTRKGSPNKITAELKDMILNALDLAGGERYLLEQAQKNPTAFLTLVGKILPMQLTGENGGTIKITVGVDPKDI